MREIPEAAGLGQYEEWWSFHHPVTIAFAPDGAMYISERLTGNLVEMKGGHRRTVCHFEVPYLRMHHETGLLGLALAPDFDRSRAIYAYHTVQEHDNPWSNHISRVNVDTGEEEAIIAKLPAGQIHNGGTMAFGPDGKLYVGVGEFHMWPLAQIQDFPAGKVLRMNPDGSVPSDNPFRGSLTYSYGHRNIFGLAFNPSTGQLFVSEQGPDHNDEINAIQKGGNYGWPLVTGRVSRPEFVDPIQTFVTVITPTQCAFESEDRFYFGSWNFGEVQRMTLGGRDFHSVVRQEVVFHDRPWGIMGVFISPRGEFYITRPEGIARIELEVGEAYDRAVA